MWLDFDVRGQQAMEEFSLEEVLLLIMDSKCVKKQGFDVKNVSIMD